MIIPAKLKRGDGVRVVAPAQSLVSSGQEFKDLANQHFDEMGLKVSFGKHVTDKDVLNSSSIEVRVNDLHEAFSDKSVNLVIAAMGGFNSNQLLKYLDYDLIKANPKIFCGFSDITAIANAIYAKTGLVTYSGPLYQDFENKKGFDYSLEYFKKCLLRDEPFNVIPSTDWSNDKWWEEQEHREFIKNEGFWLINEGEAQGRIIGGNQCTLNLLQGTEFMPDMKDSILFLEDDYEAHPKMIDRDLQSIIHQPDFKHVKGIVFGRFEKATKMTNELFAQIIKSKKELDNIPVIGNVDFGHTDPIVTFPIGGSASLTAKKEAIKLQILEH